MLGGWDKLILFFSESTVTQDLLLHCLVVALKQSQANTLLLPPGRQARDSNHHCVSAGTLMAKSNTRLGGG